jgi:hypothetical protein
MKRAISIVREQVLDAADLVVDFATLGEYGIEPEPVPAQNGSLLGSTCGAPSHRRRPSGLPSGAPHPLHDRAGVPEQIAA